MNVSIICACKNRIKPLTIALHSWLLCDEIKEIIIVDWSSDESISYLTEIDPKIKVISVPDKEYFNQPQPLNLAASITTGDYILKFDSDHVINPYWNFFDTYSIGDNSFASGFPNYESPEYVDESGKSYIDLRSMKIEEITEYCNQYNEYYKSLVGMLFVKKENFVKCGGYNENLGEFYGFEDEELTKRLELLGLTHKKMNYDHNLFHIPHPDAKRIENFKEGNTTLNYVKDNLSQFYSGDVLESQSNYGAAQRHVNHNKNNFGNPESYYVPSKTKWNIKKIDEQSYIAREITISDKLKDFPPAYYTTLEECVDRQRKIEDQFSNYGVNIKPFKSKRFSESNDVITGKYLYQLNDQTQGCIVSHLKAIKSWYETNDSSYAFFCEDDLSLKTVEHWNFTWREFVENLPSDWEGVQLMTIRGDFDDICFRDRRWDDWSQTAYIITRNYAKKLIENYCIDNTFHLELKDLNVMPIGENILFTNIGKVYTFSLFVEDVSVPTTAINDTELKDGQKPNHIYASNYVYEWWKNNGKSKTIEELMGIKSMKKHNVVDCFTYFNEKEILELRINLLKDHVDKFVIVDGNYTFSGNPKEYALKSTIKELGLPEEIIEVIEVDLSEESLGEPTEFDSLYHPSHCSRERVQRDAIAKCLETNHFDNDTVFIISDADEIINPDYIPMMRDLVRSNRHNIFKLDLIHFEGRADFRVYDKNNNSPRKWMWSLFLCLKEHMENVSLNNVRANFNNPYSIVWPHTIPRTENGVYIPGEIITDLGWHFTWMGNAKNKIMKSNSFSHANQSFDFLSFGSYCSEEMETFMNNYVFKEGSTPPSGDINCIIKPYPIKNLPQIIFDLPRVKDYLLPEEVKKKEIQKTELEQLLYEFSLDTENPEKNFNLGVWYENDNHTAPALSYFLRCAERSYDTDKDLAYEALLHASHCYDKQGTRDGSSRSLLWQAQMFLPKRPEAYYLLAKIAEKNQWWQDCYSTCELGLLYCDFDCPDLKTYVDYPGKHGLMFLKANSAWWWGKGDESRFLYKHILENYELNENDYKLVEEKYNSIGGELQGKKKFFDCGAHLFQGFTQIANDLSIDKTWECYCFEANQFTYKQSLERYSELLNEGFNIKHFNNAISDSNSIINVNCVKAEHYDQTEIGSFTSQASNTLSDRPEYCNWRELIYDSSENKVQSIDLSEYISTVSDPKDYIVIKLDIEGSEFNVLDKLILDKTIEYINEIYIEFHPHFFKDSDLYLNKIKEYKKIFKDYNIKFTQWF